MDKLKVGLASFGVIVVAVLILGYMGFIPVLSDLLGANRTQNLGIKYTDADYNSATSKLGITLAPNSVNSTSKILIKGASDVDTTLNSAELTALVNKLAEKWKSFPLANTQIRINSDGSVEVVGSILNERFNDFAQAINLPDAVKSEMAIYSTVVKTNPSFYMKFTLSVNEGVVQSHLDAIKVGNVQVPASEIDGLQGSLHNFLQSTLVHQSKITIKDMVFSDNSVHVVGTLPTELSLSPP